MYWKPAVQLQQEEYTFSSFKKPPLRFCLRHVVRQASTVQVAWALLTETWETQKKPAQTPESLPNVGSGHMEAAAAAFYCPGYMN